MTNHYHLFEEAGDATLPKGMKQMMRQLTTLMCTIVQWVVRLVSTRDFITAADPSPYHVILLYRLQSSIEPVTD